MSLTIEVEQEEDGRWLAEVTELAGVLAYGQSREEAIARAEALALRVLADRLEHGEALETISEPILRLGTALAVIGRTPQEELPHATEAFPTQASGYHLGGLGRPLGSH